MNLKMAIGIALFVLVAMAMLAGLIGMWCLALKMLSWFGGWAGLAAKYGTDLKRHGRTFAMRSGKVGWVSYGGCLNVGISATALHLSVLPMFRCGHPPLLIPWADVRDPKPRGMLFWRSVQVSVGSPVIARITLPKQIFDAVSMLDRDDIGEAEGEAST